ncbi:uncharacterized protein LOC120694228 [Panicum virgatum]|uniref:uncharacterized protein LOC120694228 n=2 Tax=Panicum virgatum TaxID=38727 RepID=UPI0019D5F4F2|nr:uncharacterized protein LOC120694228 [Panicum virgatum]
MISCLVGLLIMANAADEIEKKSFLEAQNKCGETALHHAVRRACMMQSKRDASHRSNSVDCIDKLMTMDPWLACIPDDDEDGASPLYLAISLGEMEIAQRLSDKSKGKLSYSGPGGRNVLHAAVSCANNVQA